MTDTPTAPKPRQLARDAADSVLPALLADLARGDTPLLRNALRLAAAEAVEAVTPHIAAARSPERMLREFHSTAHLPLPDKPTAQPDLGSQTGRALILAEEVDELAEAIDAGDIVKIADACADIVYAVVGTAVTYGIPFDRVLAEVHRSNMTKLIGEPVVNGDGKILKGPHYEPPRIAEVLAEASDD